MGWDSDHIIFDVVRDKILKKRYAGVYYNMLSSYSPFIIRHRPGVTHEEKVEITALFPDFIRVEFQETEDNDVKVVVDGRGELIRPENMNGITFKVEMQDIDGVKDAIRQLQDFVSGLIKLVNDHLWTEKK